MSGCVILDSSIAARKNGKRLPCEALQAENTKLRDALKALMVGTYAELCSDRDAPQCRECSMRRDECECAITEAMELLGLFADGTPVGTVDERGRNRVTGKRDQ